ncbi:hypothetical protein JCM1841_006845 [Sporobolomyces salmonicolor]
MATVKPEDASSSPAPCKFEVITIVGIDASINPPDEDPVSLETKHEGEGVDVVSVVNKYPPSPHASDTSSIDELKPPDGALRAWINVLGGWLVLFSSFGYTNTFGVDQAYYMQTIYSSYSESAISWIGSVQLGLFFLMALAAGPLFDNEHPHSLLRCRAQADGTLSQRANSAFSSLSDPPSTSRRSFSFRSAKFWQTMVVQGVMSGIGVGLLFLPELFANPSVGFVDGVRASGYIIAGCLAIANLIMSPHPGRHVAHKPPPPPLKKIFTPTYICMASGAFLLNFGWFFPNFYVQVYAEAQGLDTNLAFYAISIFKAASVFGRTIPNIMADHLGPFNLQTTCCVCAGIVLFCMLCLLLPSFFAEQGDPAADDLIPRTILYGFFSGGSISLLSSAVVSISNDLSEIGLGQVRIAFLIVAGSAVGGNPTCRRLPSEHSNDFKYLIVLAGTMVCPGAAVTVVTAVGRCLWAKEKGTWKV